MPPKLPEPTPERIKRYRLKANLTQAQAAKMVHLQAHVRWSEYERDIHAMPLATWELFLYKIGRRVLVVEDALQ